MPVPRPFSVVPRFVGSAKVGTVGAISAGATAVVAVAFTGIPTDGIVIHDLPSLEEGLLTTKATIPATGTNVGKVQFGITNTTGSPVTPSATQYVRVYVL